MFKRFLLVYFLFSHVLFAADCPKNFSGIHLQRKYYQLSFRRDHRIPEWTCHRLDRQMLGYPSDRSSPFKEDPMLPHISPLPTDYKGSGYDRGHLVPAADMSFIPEAAADTFYMSNIAPQVASFNRGIWLRAEEKVRNMAKTYGSVLVVSGAILTEDLKKLSPSGISIPKIFFKIIYYNGQVLSYAIPNEGSDKDLENYRSNLKSLKDPLDQFSISLEALEAISGINF